MPGPVRQDARVQSLIDRIEIGFESADQRAAIEELAGIPGPDAGRALIGCYRLSQWRQTRVQLLRALGRSGDLRVIEFLMRVASCDTDLPMAAEAVVALGNTRHPQALEFLLGMLDRDNHPLQKEVIIALSQNPLFPCDQRLLALLARADRLAATITQYLVLALARRRCPGAWPEIRAFLDPRRPDQSGPVFNAALIAAGLLGKREDIAFLRSLDLRFHFFAEQLVQVAIMQIENRCGSRLDDLVTLMLASDTRESRYEYLIAMRDFGYPPIRDAVHALQQNPDAEIALLLQVMFPDPARMGEALECIAADGTAAPDLAAIALKNSLRLDPQAGWELASRRLPRALLLGLLQSTVVAGAETFLADQAMDAEASPDLRVQAINALVGQVLMRDEAEYRHRIGRLLSRVVAHSDLARVRCRAIRALGQIRHDEAAILATLSVLLKEDPDARPSIYSALGMMGSPEAAKVAMKRLRVVLGRADNTLEIQACLKALGDHGTALDPELLGRMTTAEREAAGVWLLRLLARQQIDGFKPTIKAALESAEFRTRLLAVVAAGVSRDPELVARLFGLLGNSNEALAGRALYALATGGTPPQHLRLLQRAMAEGWPDERLRRLFDSMNVGPDPRYASLAEEIERWLAGPCTAGAEIRLLAANLCDNVRILLGDGVVGAGRAADAAPSAADRHGIDGELAAALPPFDRLSETIRSVLRNAELTYRNPGLFNSRVDKSTVIVEFVKSIDLFLQEKLGPPILMRSGSTLFVRMQSRIVELQLDDDSIAAVHRLRDLQCQPHFTVDDFPNHKLVSICRAILSGKILKDQYRTIDGPRAWAVLLIAFAREVSSGGRKLPAILPVSPADSRQIGGIAAALNRMQEIRNQAAHRGTLLNQSEVHDIRSQSLRMLEQLTAILGR